MFFNELDIHVLIGRKGMLLQGKTAIITGSNRGIGKAILTKFAENGANIIAHARKETEEFVAYLSNLERQYGVTVVPVYFDAREETEMNAAVKQITSITKDIDILVNNMGTVNTISLFQMTPMQSIKEEFEVNFFAQMRFTQYISRLMTRKKKGSIVNISSVAGLDGNTGMLQYVSSKAAMIGATKRLAIELGSSNIRVNSVAPGLTDTDMGNRMKEELENEKDALVSKLAGFDLHRKKAEEMLVYNEASRQSFETGLKRIADENAQIIIKLADLKAEKDENELKIDAINSDVESCRKQENKVEVWFEKYKDLLLRLDEEKVKQEERTKVYKEHENINRKLDKCQKDATTLQEVFNKLGKVIQEKEDFFGKIEETKTEIGDISVGDNCYQH